MSVAPKSAWQFYERLPRPALRWAALFGAVWAMGVCDLFSFNMGSETRGVILAFVALVYGLRGWEKLRETKPEPDPLAFDPYSQPQQYGPYR